tara:strand:- start:88 stop:300 length:213 start_codon:yes stop_codon:yes gene_type:complete
MVEIQKMKRNRRKKYKSPIICTNSYWEKRYEDTNTPDKAPKSYYTLVMGQKIQNNNQQEKENTEKTKIQK